LQGTELIGQVAGSGLREPSCLVRRCDGQVVQLSHLLYVIASRMDGRERRDRRRRRRAARSAQKT
jgi:putative peptide zinc metalloprotease protein